MKKLLSQGSYGKVYLMEEKGEKFIRKVFTDVYSGCEDARKETRTLLELRKHDCAKYFVCIRGKYDDYVTVLHDEDLSCYFDLEYIENSYDLYQYIYDNPRLNISSKISLIYAILKAFSSLHRICEHNDVKSSNILCTVNVEGKFGIKIIDYGLSCLEKDKKCHKDMEKIGFANYFAPEYYNQEEIVYQKADIWQIGLVIYYIVFGKIVPWPNESREYLSRIDDETVSHFIDYKSIIQYTESDKKLSEDSVSIINEKIKELLKACLRVNPEDRVNTETLLAHFTNSEVIRECIDKGVDSLINDFKN